MKISTYSVATVTAHSLYAYLPSLIPRRLIFQAPGNEANTFQPGLVCRYVFKLADFGTARELAPGETFFSLHGTEEYLYPGMYERALVNPQKKKDFSAKVCAALCHSTL